MKFQRELAWEIFEEVVPLLIAHYREIARYPDIKLNPNVEFYFQVEENNALRIYTARDEDQVLRGYAIFFVKPNPHYKDSLQAVQDILFLDKDYRKGFTGIRLIKYADDQLRAEGVQAVYHHVKVYKDFGPVLERMGYEAVDVIYAKRLDHGNKRGSDCDSGSGSGSVCRDEAGTQTPIGAKSAGSPGSSTAGGRSGKGSGRRDEAEETHDVIAWAQ